MTGMKNKEHVHKLVQDQYEKYPYPAPQNNLYDFIENKSFQAGCPSQLFHLYWPFNVKRLDLDILVAGCGTVQAPKFAVNLPNARISAIDISDNSIDHTERLLKLHNIKNVTTHKLPIEDIGSLGKEFDLIISTGVLHHLPDPVEGLNALQSVLRADGAMYLMLYGKYGRDGIYYIQELLKRAGLTASTVTRKELSTIRKLVSSLPPYHPLIGKAHFFNNFQVCDEELVDLLLHPQDKSYSVTDIVDYMDKCGMQLQSMLFRAHYSPKCCGITSSGFLNNISQQPEIEQFSIGELYRAAVHMHFFIACKKTRDINSYNIDLDGPDWKSLIPVRNFPIQYATKSPQEDYKAFLYSPIHQFKDILCPVREEELSLLNKSNNRYNIGEIQDAVKTSTSSSISNELVRNFYKKMRDYDFLSFRGSQ